MSASSSPRVIAHERVLRYLYEFLDENGYQQTLRALQAESRVPYNTIHVAQDHKDSNAAGSARKHANKEFAPPSERNLELAVMEGSWAEVLHVYVDSLLLPEEVKATLYEVILEEMVELHGLIPAARSLLLNAPIFQLIKMDTPARYIRLEKMIEQAQRTASEGSTHLSSNGANSTSATLRRVTPEMRQRRASLLQQLKTAIHFSTEAPVGRLAAALARAMGSADALPPTVSTPQTTVTQSPGSASSRKRDREPERPCDAAWADTFLQYPLSAPKDIQRRLPYTGQHSAGCCAPLHTAGEYLLLVGRADGVVDVVEPATGETKGNSLRHTDGVLSIARDGGEEEGEGTHLPVSPEWVAVGYRDGWVKVYNVESRKLVRRFERVHTMGVTSLFFTGPRTVEGLSGHQSLIVTGSFDGTVQVLDIAAGAVTCTVANCHGSAFVHALLPLRNRSTPLALNSEKESARFCFVSSGNDGTLGVWRLEDERQTESGIVAVHRVQNALTLGQLHQELRDAVPTQLYALPCVERGTAVHGDAVGMPAVSSPTSSSPHKVVLASQEVLILTRTGKACVGRLIVQDEGSHYYSIQAQALCLIATAHPLRSAFPRVHTVVSLSVPLLTLYAADSEGTVSLHNIEMKWRHAEQWAEFGGCMKVSAAADQSSLVIVEVGKAVRDLQLTCVWPAKQHQPSNVVAYSPALPAVYDMS